MKDESRQTNSLALGMLVITFWIGGCASMTYDRTGPFASPPRRNLDGGLIEIDLLARAFLPRNQRSAPGFSYYGYLLFADRTSASLKTRRAACVGVLEILDGVKEVKLVKKPGTEIPLQESDLAVLYTPVKSVEAARGIIKERRVLGCVRDYDYVTALLWANILIEAGGQIPGVALVGSTRPIDSGEHLDREAVYIVNLSAEETGVVHRKIQHFSGRLRSTSLPPENSWQDTVRDLSESFFHGLGDSLRRLSDSRL